MSRYLVSRAERSHGDFFFFFFNNNSSQRELGPPVIRYAERHQLIRDTFEIKSMTS